MDLPDAPASLYLYAHLAAAAGYRCVAGIDEAGRGPLAGPVVAAAVCLPLDLELDGLNDSKQVTPEVREFLHAALTANPLVRYGIAVVDHGMIDRVNILQATWMAMRQAALVVEPDFILVDGSPVRGLPSPSRSIVKGDAKCASIAAASILAKVHRDRLMVEYDRQYPGYGFAQHKGYCTPAHVEALMALGPCPIHRRSFRPVSDFFQTPVQADLPFICQQEAGATS